MRKWIYWPDNASGRVRTRTFIVSWIIYSRPCTRPALSHSPPFQRLLLLPRRFVRGVFLETRSFHFVSKCVLPAPRFIPQLWGSTDRKDRDCVPTNRTTKGYNDEKIRTDRSVGNFVSFFCFLQTIQMKFSSNESFYRFSTRYIEIQNVWLTSNKGIIMSTIYAKECINTYDETEDGIYAKIFSAWNNIRVYSG